MYDSLKVPVSTFITTNILDKNENMTELIKWLANDYHCHSHSHNTQSFDSKNEITTCFSKFKEQIASNDSIPYTTSELRRLRGLRAVILYYIFGWSWTKIGKKYKLKLLCDHIHLNEKGGDLMEQLAKEFLSS